MGPKSRGKAVLFFSAGTRFLSAPGSKPPRKASKLRWRLHQSIEPFWKGCASPLFDASALFQLLCIPAFLFFIAILGGQQGLWDAMTSWGAAFLALLVTLPAWFLINLLLAPFRARVIERQKGKWVGERFIYHTPKHAFTCEWTPAANGTFEEFEFSDAAAHALVDYTIQVKGPSERICCVVIGSAYIEPFDSVLERLRFAPNGRVRLRKGKRLRLYCYSQPSTIPVTVYVFVSAWEIGDTRVVMEYTDLKTQTRFVLDEPDEEVKS